MHNVTRIGVVRSFETGTTFTLAESMLDMLDAISPDKDKRFLLTHVGVNNLPRDLSDTLRARAADRGYANSFEALRASVPWRPLLVDESGARTSVRPRVAGPLIATVVGPDGSTQPQGNRKCTSTRSAASASATSSRTPTTRARPPAPGCACSSRWPATARACPSSRASATRCSSASSTTTSSGPT